MRFFGIFTVIAEDLLALCCICLSYGYLAEILLIRPD
jgi:hypothetical protein